jgi:hypothetical protein
MKLEDISNIPENEYVTCQRIVEHCRENRIPYIKPDPIKFGERLTSNRGWNGFHEYHDLYDTPVLVTGYSDWSIGLHETDILDSPALRKWFANNVDVRHDKLVAVPMGPPNEIDFKIHGNTRKLHEVAQRPRTVWNLMYMNFKIDTYPPERTVVLDMFSEKEWVTVGSVDCSEEGHEKYLEEIRNHRFCICPRGNGVDSHRIWECLYLGCIPICKNSVTLQQFSGLLPILFVDDWSEVTPEYLEKVYDEFSKRDWDVSVILMSFWKERIVI